MQTLSRPFAIMMIALMLVAGLAACATSPAASATSVPAAASAIAPTVAAAADTAVAVAPTVAALATDVAPTVAAAATAVAPTVAAALTMTRLNLNDVSAEQLLATIPDFSQRMVREFQEYRPYVSIQQFRKEIGKYVSAEQVTAWEQYVYVPVAVNDADAATLQQIPGVDASEADALIAARPYASNEAFLAALAQYVAPEELAAAAGYLAAQ